MLSMMNLSYAEPLTCFVGAEETIAKIKSLVDKPNRTANTLDSFSGIYPLVIITTEMGQYERYMDIITRISETNYCAYLLISNNKKAKISASVIKKIKSGKYLIYTPGDNVEPVIKEWIECSVSNALSNSRNIWELIKAFEYHHDAKQILYKLNEEKINLSFSNQEILDPIKCICCESPKTYSEKSEFYKYQVKNWMQIKFKILSGSSMDEVLYSHYCEYFTTLKTYNNADIFLYQLVRMYIKLLKQYYKLPTLIEEIKKNSSDIKKYSDAVFKLSKFYMLAKQQLRAISFKHFTPKSKAIGQYFNQILENTNLFLSKDFFRTIKSPEYSAKTRLLSKVLGEKEPIMGFETMADGKLMAILSDHSKICQKDASITSKCIQHFQNAGLNYLCPYFIVCSLSTFYNIEIRNINDFHAQIESCLASTDREWPNLVRHFSLYYVQSCLSQKALSSNALNIITKMLSAKCKGHWYEKLNNAFFELLQTSNHIVNVPRELIIPAFTENCNLIINNYLSKFTSQETSITSPNWQIKLPSSIEVNSGVNEFSLKELCTSVPNETIKLIMKIKSSTVEAWFDNKANSVNPLEHPPTLFAPIEILIGGLGFIIFDFTTCKLIPDCVIDITIPSNFIIYNEKSAITIQSLSTSQTFKDFEIKKDGIKAHIKVVNSGCSVKTVVALLHDGRKPLNKSMLKVRLLKGETVLHEKEGEIIIKPSIEISSLYKMLQKQAYMQFSIMPKIDIKLLDATITAESNQCEISEIEFEFGVIKSGDEYRRLYIVKRFNDSLKVEYVCNYIAMEKEIFGYLTKHQELMAVVFNYVNKAKYSLIVKAHEAYSLLCKNLSTLLCYENDKRHEFRYLVAPLENKGLYRYILHDSPFWYIIGKCSGILNLQEPMELEFTAISKVQGYTIVPGIKFFYNDAPANTKYDSFSVPICIKNTVGQ